MNEIHAPHPTIPALTRCGLISRDWEVMGGAPTTLEGDKVTCCACLDNIRMISWRKLEDPKLW